MLFFPFVNTFSPDKEVAQLTLFKKNAALAGPSPMSCRSRIKKDVLVLGGLDERTWTSSKNMLHFLINELMVCRDIFILERYGNSNWLTARGKQRTGVLQPWQPNCTALHSFWSSSQATTTMHRGQPNEGLAVLGGGCFWTEPLLSSPSSSGLPP